MKLNQAKLLKVGDRVVDTDDNVKGTVIARPLFRATIRWDDKGFSSTVWIIPDWGEISRIDMA